jgi:hypothetical protein
MLVTGLLARRPYPEGPATGHLSYDDYYYYYHHINVVMNLLIPQNAGNFFTG